MAKQAILTKKDVDFLLSAFKSVFLTKTEFEDSQEKLEKVLKKHRSDLITHLDKILKEVTTNREERTVISHKLTNNEERISNLEQIHPSDQHPAL